MSFRLVPNSVTLDDLERRISYIRSVISLNSVTFGADYVKVVEDTPYLLQRKCRTRPPNLFLAIYHLWRYWQGSPPPRESDKVRHSVSLGKIWPIINWKRCKIWSKLVSLIGSRIWAFDWYQNRWPWMTLNGVMAVTLRYFSEVGKPALQRTISGGINARVYCIFSRVRTIVTIGLSLRLIVALSDDYRSR